MAEKKPRVYQVAKDFNISSEALLEILRGLGVQAKSHMSTVDPAVIDRVGEKFQEEKEAVKAQDARKQEVKAQIEAHEAERAEAPSGSPSAVETAPPVDMPQEKAPAPEPPKAKPAPAPKPAAPSVPRPQAADSESAGPKRPTVRPQSSGPRPGAAPARPQRQRTERKRRKVDEQAVRDNVKRTLAGLSGGKSKRYKKRVTEKTDSQVAENGVATETQGTIRVTELASVSELADKLEVTAPQLITKLMGLGKMATLNQRLDKDTIELLALEYEYAVEFEEEYGSEKLEEVEDKPEDLKPRPPVVTVMGHVDHGKTSLLDYIRKTNVVAGEKGGITQHIGAYEVELEGGRQVSFLDTPGHQAFTAMRARGAQITDVVVLVVAADDRVMPQTIEAIDHANAAEVPIVVAINKVDKPDSNAARVKQELTGHNLVVEEFGGKVPSVEISAKTGQGIDELMEILLLQADLLELKANPDRRARGVVIESKVEQGRGAVATVLVQVGTLRVGDPFVCGAEYGKVRAMFDERGRRVKEAMPSQPVEVTGWSGTPSAGDIINAVASEVDARDIGIERGLLERERRHRKSQQIRLANFHEQLEAGKVEELRLIIKADVAGSAEVLAEQLGSIQHDEVRCEVIHTGIGTINESDVLLASASSAVIIGFNVKAEAGAAGAATHEGVDIKTYNIIYEAVADVTSALEGLLKPEEVEKDMATIEVRQVFKVSKQGAIAGCYVQKGTVNRNQKAKLIREGEVVHSGGIASLKRFKDDVREVAQGYECGVGLDHDDIREGDIIQTYVIEEVARRL